MTASEAFEASAKAVSRELQPLGDRRRRRDPCGRHRCQHRRRNHPHRLRRPPRRDRRTWSAVAIYSGGLLAMLGCSAAYNIGQWTRHRLLAPQSRPGGDLLDDRRHLHAVHRAPPGRRVERELYEPRLDACRRRRAGALPARADFRQDLDRALPRARLARPRGHHPAGRSASTRRRLSCSRSAARSTRSASSSISGRGCRSRRPSGTSSWWPPPRCTSLQSSSRWRSPPETSAQRVGTCGRSCNHPREPPKAGTGAEARRGEKHAHMAPVGIRDVRKSFGAVEVIHGVDVDITDGEFVILVGPSGCGKSTLLRMIAGLEQISQGDILIGDRVVNNVPPKERDIAMVFQNYALYPHMTVADNMGFSLKLRRIEKQRDPGARRQGGRHPRPAALPRRAIRASSPAASASASPWAARSCATRRSSCSTSRCRTSTPSCASPCAPRSRSCTSGSAPPPSTSRTTRSRP